MVYLNYISRVLDQNCISQLYIEGSGPEWYISTIYRGFWTRMVYLNYIEGSRPEWYISTIYRGFRSRMVYLNYISRVPDQNGISQLYIKGSGPEWYISTIYRGFWTRMVYLNYISRVLDQNGISQLYRGFRTRMVYLNCTTCVCCDIPFWSGTPNTIAEIYRSVWKPSIYQAHSISCPPPSTTSRNNLVKNQGHWNIFRDTLHRRVHTHHNNNCATQTLVHAYSP